MDFTNIVVIAFDIERSGGLSSSETIAIGLSAVNDKLEQLDSLFLPGYFGKDNTAWEQRCWDEFWSKNEDKLDQLKYTGGLSKSERQKEMINAFQEFRIKWERLSKKHGFKLELVCDNIVFDGGFINQMIAEHMPSGTLPLPYSADKTPNDDGVIAQKYKSLWETHSVQRGLLAVVDPDYKTDWGYTKRINELYSIPPMDPEITHDHLPHHDAYTIACEQQVVNGIRDRTIVRKKKMN